MQIAKEQLERQQQIMAVLGFYKGAIDGTWGPRSIDAMSKWEADKSFKPGIPSGGMPLKELKPWPAGVYREASGLLSHPAYEKKVADDAAAAAAAAASKSPQAAASSEDSAVETTPKKK